MNIPFFKEVRIGAYLLKQKLLGRKRYSLVLILAKIGRPKVRAKEPAAQVEHAEEPG